jgi:hypothetical protein
MRPAYRHAITARDKEGNSRFSTLLATKARNPIAGKRVTPSKATTLKSSKASLLGFMVGEIMPRWRDVDSRELNMPPRAPPPSKKGGTSTRRPLMTRNWLILELITNPDPVEKAADIIKMKKLSLTIFVVNTGFLLLRSTPEIMQTKTIIKNQIYLHMRSFTATKRHGSVIISPTDVIKGAVTLSGSHPLEKLCIATKRVNTRMNMLEINPPMTDMTTRSMMEIEAKSKMRAVTRERIARQKETVNVRKTDAAILPLITGDRSSLEISPMWRAVLIREPKEAKIFPRIPMAGGIMIINPGSNSSVSENVPR